MFTGIIETLGTIKDIKKEGSNIHFLVGSNVSKSLKIDQSIAHNGVCLTVTNIEEEQHWVTAIDETLAKSNLGTLSKGDPVNLERCLKLGDRLDGHIVQGHVDTKTSLIDIKEKDGSWHYTFELLGPWKAYIVPKGSICINGVSLTVSDLLEDSFEVAIIPYTYENTTFHSLKVNDLVNLEFDIVGKYILRNEQIKKG